MAFHEMCLSCVAVIVCLHLVSVIFSPDWIFLPDDDVRREVYTSSADALANSSSWFDAVAGGLLGIEEGARTDKINTPILLWAGHKKKISTRGIRAGTIQSEPELTKLGGLNHMIIRKDLFTSPSVVEFLPRSLLSRLSHSGSSSSEKDNFNRNLSPGHLHKSHGAGVVESNFIKELLTNQQHLLDSHI